MNKVKLLRYWLIILVGVALLQSMPVQSIQAAPLAQQKPLWPTLNVSAGRILNITDAGFDPPELAIFGPTDITWVNTTNITHTLSSRTPNDNTVFLPLVAKQQIPTDSRSWLEQWSPTIADGFSVTLPPGASYTRRLHTPGNYLFYLATQPQVIGKVSLTGTALLGSSPTGGEAEVAVTRETILEFSGPLDPATVTSAALVARFGGQPLAARIHLSPDKTHVTLFYDEPLPGSARVRVTIDGSHLKDAAGLAVDVDGDGQPGGTATIDFDTLSLTVLPGTVVCGRVFASELAVNASNVSVNTPLQGVTVSVDGLEEALHATTDADGNFCLNPAPAGRFFVHIDGRTATNGVPAGAYYPFVGKAWQSIPGQQVSVGDIYLPLVVPGTLQSVSQNADTTLHFPPAVLDKFPEFGDVSIRVPANSLYADDGARDGKVGIAPVPPDRLPGSLPPGLEFPVVITVQTDGASNFDKPVPACFPNLPDPGTGQPLPPGAKNFLYSFNHDTGEFEPVGSMTVSVDGQIICTDPGVGIVAPGWHGSGPVPVKPPPPPECPDSGGAEVLSAQVGSGCNRQCTDPEVERARQLECERRSVKKEQACEKEKYFNLPTALAACVVYKDPRAILACMATVLASIKYGIEQCELTYEQEANECINANPCNQASNRNTSAGQSLMPFVEDPALDSILQLLQQIVHLLYPYAMTGTQELPEEIQNQVDDLLSQASTLADGDIGRYLSSQILQLEGEIALIDATIGASRGNAPPYSVHYMAEVIRSTDSLRLRGRTEPLGQYTLFVPRDGTLLFVSFYDPKTKSYGIVNPHLREDAPYRLPRFTLVPVDTFPDFDNDGLADLVEFIYGTNTGNPDTDNDGIKDGTEVEQGTDPLGDLIAQTGLIASADTPGTAVDVCVTNDLAIIADAQAGVSVFNVFSGMNPTIIAQVDTPGNAQAVACAGNRIAVADGAAGLAIVDITDPPAARIVQQLNLGGEARAVKVEGGIAYVGLATGQVVAVELAAGAVVQQVTVPDAVQDLAIEGDTLYVLTTKNLYTIALNPFEVVGTAPSPGSLGVGQRRMRLFVGGGVAYAVHTKGYNTFTITNPAQPFLIATGNTSQFGWKQIVANGSGLGVAAVGPNSTNDGPHDISLYDVSNPAATDAFITTFATPGLATAVALYNGLAYVADGAAGLQVINYLAYDAQGVPPTIALATNFAPGVAEAGAPMRVTANVDDDVQVRNVEFYVDGVLRFTDGSFPFEHRFTTPTLAQQPTFTLRAKATDTGGNATWTDLNNVTLTADATPPRVVNVSPTANSIAEAGALAIISATFNESINPSTLTNTTFQLFAAGADGTPGNTDDVPVNGGAVSYQSDTRTVLLTFANALPTGTYYAVVAPPLADAAGNQIAVARAWTFDLAPFLTFGSVVADTIAPIGDTDTFFFSGVAGDQILIRIIDTPNQLGFDSQFRVYRPDGSELCEEVWHALTEKLCRLDASGTHRLLVNEAHADNTGSFQIFLQRINNPVNTTPITFGDTVAGAVTLATQMNGYTFNGAAGDQVLIRMIDVPNQNGFDSDFRLYRPDGSELCQEAWHALTEKVCTLDVAGVYILLAGEAHGDTVGSYQLSLQRTNNPTNATATTFGSTVTASLSFAAQMHVYTFSGVAGDRILIRMIDIPNQLGFDSQFRLYRPNGAELCSEAWHALTEKLCLLDASGTYVLLVNEAHADNPGSYQLSLQRTNNPASPTPITLGNTTTGTLTFATQTNAYTFSGAAGNQVLIRMIDVPDQTGFDSQFRVYRPDGTELCRAEWHGLAEKVCMLDVSGVHVLLAGEAHGDKTGTYQISLQ